MKRMAQPVIEEAQASLGDERYRELYDVGARTTVEEATRLVLARQ